MPCPCHGTTTPTYQSPINNQPIQNNTTQRVHDAMDEAQFRLLRQRPLSLSHAAAQARAAENGGELLGTGRDAGRKKGGAGGPRKPSVRAATAKVRSLGWRW